MLYALIRPDETTTVEVAGGSLADVTAQMEAHRQPGFALISAPVRMLAGKTDLEATGTFRRVDGVQEIEADDMDALAAKVPDGWRMLSVRKV